MLSRSIDYKVGVEDTLEHAGKSEVIREEANNRGQDGHIPTGCEKAINPAITDLAQKISRA